MLNSFARSSETTVGEKVPQGFPKVENPAQALIDRNIAVRIVRDADCELSDLALLKGYRKMSHSERVGWLEDVREERFRLEVVPEEEPAEE